MKAVIMAGGEGTRLRPITSGLPKPMVPIVDKPILEHTVRFLKNQQITEIAVTLEFLSGTIRNYFGDGHNFGVNIEYFTEHEPLGSAGGIANCADFLGKDDFLVISGDVLCNFNLLEAALFHKKHAADATILLSKNKCPTEYGLVMTDSDGSVIRFVEKPSWGQVFADTINSGIYIINPKILEIIPKGRPYDFARDLFPALLQNGADILGYETNGCWHDIGSPEDILECTKDILSGRMELSIEAPERKTGIRSFSEISGDVELIAPVYIGEGVAIGTGARIGPNTVIGSGSIVGADADIRQSVIMDASIGEGARINQAVVCHGVILERGVTLKSGAVLGERVLCGAGALIDSGVRIQNGVRIEEGDYVKRSILSGTSKKQLIFNEHGAVSGIANIDITPELCVSIGSATAAAGMRVGVGGTGNAVCEMLKNALISGLSAAGAQVTRIDARFASAAVYVAKSYLFNLTVFIESIDNMVRLRFFNRLGLPIEREIQRRIEGELTRGELKRADAVHIIKPKVVSGAGDAYAASLAREGGLRGFTAAVEGETAATDMLRTVLTMSGCRISPAKDGIIKLSVYEDGTALIINDEEGRVLESTHVTALIALVYFLSNGRELAIPYSAPNAIEHIASRFNGKILRVGRDGQAADEKYARQSLMCDGIACAVFLCEYLFKEKSRVSELRAQLPDFSVSSREINIDHERGSVMRAIADSCQNMHRELYEGLRVCTDAGWVHISPCEAKRALKITGEGMSEEIAEELCSMFCERTKLLDDKLSNSAY